MKDAYYTSHDFNARNDPKCAALINDYGVAGYGIYWIIIEILGEQKDYKLAKFPKLYEAIAKQCSSTAQEVLELIQAMVKDYKLLCEDDNYIWSESLIERMKEKEIKRQAKIEAGRKGGLKSALTRIQTTQVSQDEAVLEQCLSSAQASKVKYSKVNNKKEKKITKEKKKENQEISQENDNDLRNLWIQIFLHSPGMVELDFCQELVERFGLDKTKKLLYELRKNNFHSIAKMKAVINADGTLNLNGNEKGLTWNELLEKSNLMSAEERRNFLNSYEKKEDGLYYRKKNGLNNDNKIPP